jgi:hypothetical protein
MLESLTTTAVIGFILFLLRNWIVTRLKESVSFEYNEKLENLKSDLRKNETELGSLRGSLLSGASHRGKLIYEKKVRATEIIWEAVLRLAPMKKISESMLSIKFHEAAELAETNQNVREFAKTLGMNIDISDTGYNDAKKMRPFLTEIVWAYYSAYYAVVSHAMMRQKVIEHGLPAKLMKDESVKRLVTAVYPHMQEFIEGNDTAFLHDFLDDIERDLLKELQRILDGKESDEQSLARAKEIIKATESVSAEEPLVEPSESGNG